MISRIDAMDAVLEKRLDKCIFYNKTEYFFTSLTDRFEYANSLWAKALQKKFGKKFEPIYIQNCKQNNYFKKKNYIIVNKAIVNLRRELGKRDLVYLEDYEDLNKEISESRIIKTLMNKLVKKQNRLFVLGFTSSFLSFSSPKIKVLGPEPKIVTKVDNKIEHIKIFRKLNLPRTDVRIYNNLKQLINNEKYPYYISAAYTSGGYESGPIKDDVDLARFEAKLRDVNRSNFFLAGNLIENIKVSPNVSAIVYGSRRTKIICVSDQILNGNVYLGNIYPSKVSEKVKREIIKVTKEVGDYLSGLGFRGIFGLDFIVDSKNRIYTVDLNPRRQGGYMCNLLMTQKSIVELELNVAIGAPVHIAHYDLEPYYAWAHSKIKPHTKNSEILKIFKRGSIKTPFIKPGGIFECVFYPKGHTVVAGNCGYVVVSGKNRNIVEREIEKQAKKLGREVFGENN